MKRNQTRILVLAVMHGSIATAQEPNVPETGNDPRPRITVGALACAPVGAAARAGLGAIFGSGIGTASGGTAMAGTIPLAQGGAVIGGDAAILTAETLGLDCIDIAESAAELAAQGRDLTAEAIAETGGWLRRTARQLLGFPPPLLPSVLVRRLQHERLAPADGVRESNSHHTLRTTILRPRQTLRAKIVSIASAATRRRS